MQVYSWRKDSKDALKHYERARALLLALPAKGEEEKKLINAERIGLDFDTAAALASESQNGYRYGRWGWYGWWWDNWLEPEEDSEAVEEADYEETRWGMGRGGWGGEDQQTPTGIPLGLVHGQGAAELRSTDHRHRERIP